MYWLWLFCLYSFLGYLLEKIFATVTGSRHQVRKCFLLLPLCPVYGLAMLAVLHLPADLTRGFFRLAFYGGLTATAVEYAVHFLYDKLLGVMFWDYSGTHMDLNRRVCVPFAVIWGPLTAFALRQGRAVAQVVVSRHQDAPVVEIPGKIVIPQDVLRHAVGDL